jgi:hypothetical protein
VRDGKRTKVPYSNNRRCAKANDPRTWTTFRAAVTFAATGSRDGETGVGFMFSSDDPYFGVDLDKCRAPETGAVDPWAAEIIASMPGAYAEVSPSGTCIKMIGLGRKPGTRCGGKTIPGLEIYQSYTDQKGTHGRFFALTGNRLPGCADAIGDCQEALDALYARAFPEPERPRRERTERAGGNHSVMGVTDATDAEIVDRARRARNGDKFERLWGGDTGGHGGDHSRADLALCSMLAFWTGPDPARIDALYRQSGLYRPKWDRADYRERTIDLAISGFGSFASDLSLGRSPQDVQRTLPILHSVTSDKSDTSPGADWGDTRCESPLTAYFAGTASDNSGKRMYGEHRCGRPDCPGCHNHYREKWGEHLASLLRATEYTRSSCSARAYTKLMVHSGRPYHVAEIEPEQVERTCRAINRHRTRKRGAVSPEHVQYARIQAPSGKTLIVATVPFSGSEPVTAAEARQQVVWQVKAVQPSQRGDHKRPISTSEGWSLPERKTKWKKLGVPSKRASTAVVLATASSMGAQGMRHKKTRDGLHRDTWQRPADWSDRRFMAYADIIPIEDLHKRRSKSRAIVGPPSVFVLNSGGYRRRMVGHNPPDTCDYLPRLWQLRQSWEGIKPWRSMRTTSTRSSTECEPPAPWLWGTSPRAASPFPAPWLRSAA